MASVYLSARFQRQAEMKEHRETIQQAGHSVQCRWLECDGGLQPMLAAKLDLDDLDQSDVVFFFGELPSIGYYTGGRQVELGYAIAKRIRIILIGPRENVFHHLPQIPVADNIEAALAMIANT